MGCRSIDNQSSATNAPRCDTRARNQWIDSQDCMLLFYGPKLLIERIYLERRNSMSDLVLA
jgi:hypothetical protein